VATLIIEHLNYLVGLGEPCQLHSREFESIQSSFFTILKIVTWIKTLDLLVTGLQNSPLDHSGR